MNEIIWIKIILFVWTSVCDQEQPEQLSMSLFKHVPRKQNHRQDSYNKSGVTIKYKSYQSNFIMADVQTMSNKVHSHLSHSTY